MAAIQAFFQLGMGDVPGNHNVSGQQKRRRNRMLTKLLSYLIHWSVQIDTHRFLT